jgi:hypothetical protein
LYNDIWPYRLVDVIVLTLSEESILEVIVALGSAAISGLAGLLAPSSLDR